MPSNSMKNQNHDRKWTNSKKSSFRNPAASAGRNSQASSVKYQPWGHSTTIHTYAASVSDKTPKSTSEASIVTEQSSKNLPEITPADSISNVGIWPSGNQNPLRVAVMTARAFKNHKTDMASTLSIHKPNDLQIRPANVSSPGSSRNPSESITISKESRAGLIAGSSVNSQPFRITIQKKSEPTKRIENDWNSIVSHPLVDFSGPPDQQLNKREIHIKTVTKGWADTDSEESVLNLPADLDHLTETAASSTPATESKQSWLPNKEDDPREYLDIPGVQHPFLNRMRKCAQENLKRDFGYSPTDTKAGFAEYLPSSIGQPGDSRGDQASAVEEKPKTEISISTKNVESLMTQSSSFTSGASSHPVSTRGTANTSASSQENGQSEAAPSKNGQIEFKDMDWEVKWKTTSSFKVIRPYVSEIDPNFTVTLDRIRDIIEGNSPYLPSSKRYELETLDDFQFQNDSAYGSHIEATYSNLSLKHPSIDNNGNKVALIVACSNATQNGNITEREVHHNILRAAFDSESRVVVQELDQAQICYQYLVDNNISIPTSDRSLTKTTYLKLQGEQELLKGFALGLHVDPESNLQAKIRSYLKRSEVPTISPSMYRLMRSTPSGIFVASSSVHDVIDHSRSRLSVWAASWFKRMDSFRANSGDPVPRLPVLPIISAESDIWRLYFACRSTPLSVELVGPVTIGSTAMIHEAYKLLGVLRVLDNWLNETFVTWLDALVGSGV